MKRTVILILAATFLFSEGLLAADYLVRNKTSQPLTIQLGARTVHIAPRGSARLSQAEINAPAVQTLLRRGKITVTPVRKRPYRGKRRIK